MDSKDRHRSDANPDEGRQQESGAADEADLIERMRAGDESAFCALFDRNLQSLRARVRRHLPARVRRKVSVSDVIQEAQLEAMRRIDDFLKRRPMPFRLWLRKTAYECLLRLRRQHVEARRRSVSREVPLPDRSSILLAGQALEGCSTPSQQLVEQELAQRVRVAVAQLSEEDRELLLMRNHEGLTNQEVALVLEIEPDTASKRYGRALLRLRKILTEGGLSESQL